MRLQEIHHRQLGRTPEVALFTADGRSAVAASPSLFQLFGCLIPYPLLPISSCLLYCLGVNRFQVKRLQVKRLQVNRLPTASVPLHIIIGLYIPLPVASASGSNLSSPSRPTWPPALQRNVQQAPDALNTCILALTQPRSLTLFD